MPISEGYNNTTLKQKNRGLIFQRIATNDGLSRTELAAASGLTKMAVSYIVSELLERKLVCEVEYTGSRYQARKPIMLKLSPQAPKIVGLVIHRNYVTAVLCDCRCNILKSETMPLGDCDRDAMLAAAFRVTDAVMAGQLVEGIGIGSIGPVDIEHGLILDPPDFHGIHDVAVVQAFQERYALPVYLDYHYNCAALAEKYFGCARSLQNFFFLGITEGLGLGIVAGNQLFSDFTGFSSEFGHVSIDRNGAPCFCGNRGCLGGLLSYDTEEEILRSMDYLSIALASLCNVLNPQAVVVGDEMSRLQDHHLKVLEDALNRKLLVKDYRHICVFRAFRSKGLEASSCAMNVICRFFNGELIF